jgi:hypothetical protein
VFVLLHDTENAQTEVLDKGDDGGPGGSHDEEEECLLVVLDIFSR